PLRRCHHRALDHALGLGEGLLGSTAATSPDRSYGRTAHDTRGRPAAVVPPCPAWVACRTSGPDPSEFVDPILTSNAAAPGGSNVASYRILSQSNRGRRRQRK